MILILKAVYLFVILYHKCRIYFVPVAVRQNNHNNNKTTITTTTFRMAFDVAFFENCDRVLFEHLLLLFLSHHCCKTILLEKGQFIGGTSVTYEMQ